jgi:hypothetical protein
VDLLSHLYFESGLANLGPHAEKWTQRWDRLEVRNPYAIAGVGVEYGSRVLSVDLGFRHLSSISTGHDLGDNMLQLTVRVRPWAK